MEEPAIAPVVVNPIAGRMQPETAPVVSTARAVSDWTSTLSGKNLVPSILESTVLTESEYTIPGVAVRSYTTDVDGGGDTVGGGLVRAAIEPPLLQPIPREGIIAVPGLIISTAPEPSLRTAMVDAQEPIPAPSGTPNPARNPPSVTANEQSKEQQQTASPPAPSPTPSDKNMISELVGSGYGLFSRVHDGGVYFGSEFTLLRPKHIGDARTTLTDLINDDSYNTSADIGFGTGGRYTLGVRGSEVGLRAQYWNFEADLVDIGGGTWNNPSLRHTTSSRVQMESIDVEITQRHCLLGCELESSFGGRYVDYEGMTSAIFNDELHDSLEFTGMARAMRALTGAGPTLAIAGRKNIPFCFGGSTVESMLPVLDCVECNSADCTGLCSTWRTAQPHFPLSVYWNGRISWLWADQISSAMTEATVMHQVDGASVATARARDYAYLFDDSNKSLYTFTLQLGVEYTKPIFCRSQLTLRCGIEYQHWDLGKHLAQSQSFAFLTDESTFGGRVDTYAASRNEAIILTGFTFMAGINY